MMLLSLNIIPLNLEMILYAGMILFGTLIMAIAGFIKNSPTLVLDEM
jgi:hypothetical protein